MACSQRGGSVLSRLAFRFSKGREMETFIALKCEQCGKDARRGSNPERIDLDRCVHAGANDSRLSNSQGRRATGEKYLINPTKDNRP